MAKKKKKLKGNLNFFISKPSPATPVTGLTKQSPPCYNSVPQLQESWFINLMSGNWLVGFGQQNIKRKNELINFWAAIDLNSERGGLRWHFNPRHDDWVSGVRDEEITYRWQLRTRFLLWFFIEGVVHCWLIESFRGLFSTSASPLMEMGFGNWGKILNIQLCNNLVECDLTCPAEKSADTSPSRGPEQRQI